MLDAKAAAVTLITFEILSVPICYFESFGTLNWTVEVEEDEVGWKKWLIPANAQR